jgi:hypothetical protein
LKNQFGIDKELIVGFDHPCVYLNREIIKEYNLDLRQVEQAVATELLQFEGIAQAISSTALREDNLPDILIG